ncbi:hypothetical protein C8F04DRAFT_1062023 [Mycena alexandri]|uniref:Uncharacterized protein n=1 Tax=Mycena alexandri TaxID=1745969 RepID=A0AAD6XC22_9AGAR|nr:hypothetical protein C8F04DRAFT_1062023 [Mycena alexandri]
MSQNVTYDDRDSTLQYSPGWFRTGTYNATSVGETGTLASSLITSGVNVTFVFPTPATEFFYFGMKRCCGGSYLICIDCDPNNRQFETIDAVDRTDNGQNPPVVLYSRKFDQPGVHEVILLNQPDSAFNGNSEITLDKFLLTIPDPAAIQSESPSKSLPILPLNTSPATALPQSSSSSKSTSRYLVPLLLGILGGLALLLSLVGIWLFVRRKYRRPVQNEETVSNLGDSESLWGPSSRFTSLTFPATTISTSAMREQDAGRIFENYPLPEDTLPPEYGQVFNPAARRPPSLPQSFSSSDSSAPPPLPKAMQ